MKILHLVTKNTSSIDFILPIYWKIRNIDLHSDIVIFYGVLDKRSIVGTGSYYEKMLNQIGVQQMDLLDLSGKSYLYKTLSILDARLSQLSDRVSRTDLLNSERWFVRIHQIVFYVTSIIARRGIRYIFSYVINKKNLSDLLQYDIALVDNRASVKFSGDRKIFSYIFEESQKPVVILPHAPHYVDQFFSHVRVNPFGKEMYEKCDIWMPFLPATPAENNPELEKQLFYSGYPGFDSEWIDYNKSISKRKRDNGKTSVLYIGRKFLDKDTKRPSGYNFVTMDYDDVLSELNMIHESLIANNCNYSFIYKPHPSSSLVLVEKVLGESKINDYKIVNDASYSFLGYVDIVVSPYSTALFAFAIAGIPTIVIKSVMMNEVMLKWKILIQLYGNMNFLIEFRDLERSINLIMSDLSLGDGDVTHLREYFPDGVLSEIYKRITYLA